MEDYGKSVVNITINTYQCVLIADKCMLLHSYDSQQHGVASQALLLFVIRFFGINRPNVIFRLLSVVNILNSFNSSCH